MWSPQNEIPIKSLERVQQQFLKFMTYKTEVVYAPQGQPQGVLLTIIRGTS